MRPKSLKNTLLLTTAVIIVGIGVLISQIVIHRYSDALLDAATKRAENIAQRLSLDATEKILINDRFALHKLLGDQIASDSALAYLFIIKEGRVLTHTFSNGLPAKLVGANSSFLTGRGHIEKIISEKGERYIDISWPIFQGKSGVLRLGMSEKPIRRQVRDLWIQMNLITLGVLILALFVVQIFIRQLLRPLFALERAVEKMDAGNLESHIDVKGRSEINKLVTAFNGMLERLKRYTVRLQKFNQRLDRKNKELDRAHRQLDVSLSLSKQIAAMSNLKEIGSYLIRTLKGIVACQNITQVVFNEERESFFLIDENNFHSFGKDIYKVLYELIYKIGDMQYLKPESFSIIPAKNNLTDSNRIAIFPFRYHKQLLGAILIGCPDSCECIKKELDIIRLILKQTSGAIHRASINESQIQELRSRIGHTAKFGQIVGKDPQMQIVYKLIEDVAPADSTVLIQGDSGTGKEMIAWEIFQKSSRKKGPFVVINCSAYPANLLESELFGHEKGAFTGASRQKIGRFEQAHGGTVFLDEIGEISLSAQIKLLRILQSQKFERVGGEHTIAVDVRIVAATNRDLLQEVQRGNFREDVYYRLNVIPIHLPLLKDRRNDIPLLAHHFLKKYAGVQSKNIDDFSSDAMRTLLDYPWPGNVRELENSIEHAVVLAKGADIDLSDFPASIIKWKDSTPRPETESIKTMFQNEEMLIRDALVECSWNKTETATQLGISRSTLYEKIKKYQISKLTLH